MTFSSRATSVTFDGLPLNVKAVLRATTDSAETLERSVMMSSLIPSLKYSCSGSPLMLTNGSTQIEGPRAGAGAAGAPVADGPAGAVAG